MHHNFNLNDFSSLTGLGHLLGFNDPMTHEDHVLDEMKILTEYHFRLWKSRINLHRCLDALGVAKHIWRAFQLNAYIPIEEEFPAKILYEKVRKDYLNV